MHKYFVIIISILFFLVACRNEQSTIIDNDVESDTPLENKTISQGTQKKESMTEYEVITTEGVIQPKTITETSTSGLDLLKEVTVTYEGMDSSEEYMLVMDEVFPIGTYVPTNQWSYEITENYLLIQYMKIGSIRVEILPDNNFEKNYSLYEEKYKLQGDDIITENSPIWLSEMSLYYSYDENVYNYSIFGTNDDFQFVITRLLEAEHIEAFLPHEIAIYKELFYVENNIKMGSIY